MAEEGLKSIKDRIVSLHQPQVRPIVRGKEGKEVEFGAKASVSLVDGFSFLDKISYDAYNEAKYVKESLKQYKERFGRLPNEVIADRLYGTRHNRKFLKRIGIEEAFDPLGRRSADKERYRKIRAAQRRRNAIEGAIGTGKVRYKLDRVRYRIEDGAEIWARMGLMGMNLTTALRRI